MTEARSLGDRAGRILPAGVGWALIVLGTWSTLRGWSRPLGPYDEGILLTDAYLVSLGQFPYRDFYANYPPGAFLTIAGIWKVFGVSVAAERALGIMAHLLIAGGAGWIVALMRGSRFSAPTAGVVLVWLAWLGTPSYAWLLALALAVVSCALMLRASERGSPRSWIAAGAALGAVGCFRHDLFVYFAGSLGALVALWALGIRRTRVARSEWASLGWLALGGALPLMAVWLPTMALAGVRPVLDDLYLTQVREVMPARVLPMPELSPLVFLPPLPFPVPAFVARGYEGAVALTLVGPLFALLALALAPRLGLRSRFGPAVALALSAAVLPQMLGRTDPYHAFLTVAPALLLLVALIESVGRGPGVGRGTAVAVAIGILGVPVGAQFEIPDSGPPATWQQAHERYGHVPELEPAREAVLAFIDEHSEPGDAVFVGLADHSRVFVSEMDLYFLANRPGASRIMQFDPNVVNREDVQLQMAAEIDASGTQVAILSSRFAGMTEPNESASVGSSFLDDYFRTSFEVVEVAGPYQLLRRRTR